MSSSAKKYQAVNGFAAVGKDKKKKYFSPANQHEIADLPKDEIDKHIKAGNIAEVDEDVAAESEDTKKGSKS